VSEPRAELRELSAALRALHREALRATQQSFEKLHGAVRAPGEVLQLALHDPLFAWLRPLSRQMAALDELAAADAVGAADLAGARAAVAALLGESPEFRPTYLVYLQAEPELVLAHAAVRRLLPNAPAAERRPEP
jgi:hypothetical protein